MSIQPNSLPPIQDMPPIGGYKKFNLARYFPARGPKGWQLWAGSTLMIMYGFYQVGQGNIEKNQQKMQERKVRYALAPILQAEADREYLERELVILKKEADVMKHVPGWTVGKNPYQSGKFMPRMVNPLDRGIK
mmetsp:Transcript_3072/g.2966  ORF Transcript_3072/g.2966 Transcript_3072/m.2966 type:complete len:134 (-) Transcript_3072:91-492(-)|eukprot:CAMPEP_0197828856 /NCGR_PEP_ID=MMETSP1437-20131217/5370_1 /TAXON_ID=49252 ORGANISM="Eucampia antarctica, Strain CCMP1452" /NCGR_SAMPLE_ID=MMETSP1437 /ASSEMBLY_ACC=CAM_ASM_001096 /LENGTH=133 /DNA_ID=CAMNT_0043430257 /DNA_START=132 /DNA_END=533 /DNA_ORIENTATION=-